VQAEAYTRVIKCTKPKVGQNSATLGELLPELKHVKQLILESTGIFAGQSQELDFTLSSLTHSGLDCYTLPSPRGPSKQLIWSRPRVNTVCAWVSTSFFLCLLLWISSSLQDLLASLAILCHWKYPSVSSSCQVELQLYFRIHRLQLSSTIFQVQLLAVLQDLSGLKCLLPYFQVQL
jgi:hypothetical protein